MQNNLLAKRLKELRKAHGYTQDYVAEFLGLVRQTYSHYETGKRSPSPEILFKLSEVLWRIMITTNLGNDCCYRMPGNRFILCQRA